MAYDAEVLTDEGRRRVEAHLSGCDVCREALAAMRVYDTLLADVAEEPVPLPDYPRMELPLRREARKAAASIEDMQRIVPASLLAVAAAALFFLWVGGHVDDLSPHVQRGVMEPADLRPEPSRASAMAELTLVSGTVHVDGVRAEAPGVEVGEGGVVIADERSEAHLRFAEGTGVVVEAHSEVALQELAVGRVVLNLAHGTVDSEVAHLGHGDRYEVHAGHYMIRVRGTRFAVTRKVEDVAVVVSEGVVEVVRDGRVEAVVEAPGAWRSGFAVWGDADVKRPTALEADAADWPILRVTAPAGSRAVRMGAQTYASEGLAFRVPPGETSVELIGPDGALTTRLYQVAATGEVSEGGALAPDAPEAREGYLAPTLIAPTVRAGMRRLEGCHGQEARRGEAPSGIFSLRVTIGLTGSVARAQLLQRAGEAPSRAFRQCVVQEARRWTFPPPTGGTVTFDQPLRFTTRMR